MGDDSAYIVAWLLPMLVGGGIWLALRGARTVGDFFAAIGAGWLIGVFVAAVCARLSATADTAHAFGTRGRGSPQSASPRGALRSLECGARPAVRRCMKTIPPWLRVVMALLMIWIAMRFISIGEEALLRPVFPWDAWSAWSTKPKTWFIADTWSRTSRCSSWLRHPKRRTAHGGGVELSRAV